MMSEQAQVPISHETDNEDEMQNEQENESQSSHENKKVRLDEDDRVQRCRERNRIHARNTRERKRAQMDYLQQRIQNLNDEKKRLEKLEPDSTVASILVSLSSKSATGGTKQSGQLDSGSNEAAGSEKSYDTDEDSSNFAAYTIEKLKLEISASLSDDEELEMDQELLRKEKASCTTKELEMIRRERNRMHAKKTRLRKKKMLTEMEAIIFRLEEDIRKLRQQRGLSQEPLLEANSSGAASHSHAGKFTGFRHTNRVSETGALDKEIEGLSAEVRAAEESGLASLSNAASDSTAAVAAAAAFPSAGMLAALASSAQNLLPTGAAASSGSIDGITVGMGAGTGVAESSAANGTGFMGNLNPTTLNLAAILSASGQLGGVNMNSATAAALLPMFQNLNQLHAALLLEWEKKMMVEFQAGLTSNEYYSKLLGLTAAALNNPTNASSVAVGAAGSWCAGSADAAANKKRGRIPTGFAPPRAEKTKVGSKRKKDLSADDGMAAATTAEHSSSSSSRNDSNSLGGGSSSSNSGSSSSNSGSSSSSSSNTGNSGSAADSKGEGSTEVSSALLATITPFLTSAGLDARGGFATSNEARDEAKRSNSGSNNDVKGVSSKRLAPATKAEEALYVPP